MFRFGRAIFGETMSSLFEGTRIRQLTEVRPEERLFKYSPLWFKHSLGVRYEEIWKFVIGAGLFRM